MIIRRDAMGAFRGLNRRENGLLLDISARFWSPADVQPALPTLLETPRTKAR
jgi:hypothetical protein